MSNEEPTNDAIAEAFSRHRFTETYDHLAPDVTWVAYGGPTTEGKEAVVAACDQSSAYLSDVRTEFRSFRTIAAPDVVVTESLAAYVDADGETVVASCDVYDFVDAQLVKITSFTVDVTPATGAHSLADGPVEL